MCVVFGFVLLAGARMASVKRLSHYLHCVALKSPYSKILSNLAVELDRGMQNNRGLHTKTRTI